MTTQLPDASTLVSRWTEIVRWNDSGLVEELTALGRPLAALQLVRAKVAQMLAEA